LFWKKHAGYFKHEQPGIPPKKIKSVNNMQQVKNIIIPGTDNKPIALDIFYTEAKKPQPVVVYAHGFNGFKDWGNFDIIAKRFTQEGFTMVKFNFSHNGTTPQTPEDFTDLEAFGNNNYSIQLADLRRVIDWIADPLNPYAAQIDTSNISLIGHSMGGGIAILYAATDSRIKKLVTWATISECKTPWGNWPPEKMEEWKTTGVQYYANGRTRQQMPLYHQLYEDYLLNEDRLNICKAISSLSIPLLICHGKSDLAVPVENAFLLKAWQPAAELFTSNTDHVFGRKHPWLEEGLPEAMEEVFVKSCQFLRHSNS
jgi:uncharacterized protein